MHNAVLEWSDSAPWRLEPEPAVTIGGLGGGEPYELYRVVGARVLSDGRIVVANSGTGELRYYTADGAFLSRAGHSGEGPGEFVALTAMREIGGDTVLAYDGRLRRLSIFDAGGSFVASHQLRSNGPSTAWGTYLTPTGLMLGISGPQYTIASPSGPTRRDLVAHLLDPIAGRSDTLGFFPGVEAYVRVEGRSVSLWGGLYGRSTVFAAGGDVIYAGTNDTYEIRALDPTGRVQTLIRVAREPVPITDALANERIEERLAEIDDANFRRRSRAAYAEMPVPAHLPAYRRILVDDAGHLWVLQYSSEDNADDDRWDVIRPDGRWLGTLSLPEGFRPSHIGDDFILGVWTDELDVEHVSRYRMRRAP